MNTNDRNRNLKWALVAAALIPLGAADMAWPFWLAWLANVAVIQGSSLGICLYKRNVLAWVAFWVLAAVSLTNAFLYAFADESSKAVNLADVVIAVALFGSWHYLFSAKTIRPQAAPPAQVVHHVHHGLPGGQVPDVAWTAEAYPVVTGTVERPTLGARARRQALGAAGSRNASRGERVRDLIARGLR